MNYRKNKSLGEFRKQENKNNAQKNKVGNVKK